MLRPRGPKWLLLEGEGEEVCYAQEHVSPTAISLQLWQPRGTCFRLARFPYTGSPRRLADEVSAQLATQLS
jgi:hypothetical protein